MTCIEYLDKEVRKLAPNVDGVIIGRWDAKQTWKVTGTLTDSERGAVASFFQTFDRDTYVSSIPAKTPIEERIAAVEARLALLEKQ